MALFLCGTGAAYASPIPGDPVKLTQPDGTTFEAIPGGDEWVSWMSHDGALIARDEQGWWRYGQIRAGMIEPRRARVGLEPPPAGTASLDDVPDLVAGTKIPEFTHAPEPLRGERGVTREVLVIVVSFTDQVSTTTDEYWHDLFFGTAGNSVSAYYEEVSGGDLTLIPAYNESYGTAGDGIVQVQLMYQDHNEGQHPNPYGVIDDRNRWIVYDALYRANPDVWYLTFDKNQDWRVTPDELHIVIVAAGYEHGYEGDASPTPAVHAHRWSLGGTVPPAQFDGVTLCEGYSGGGYVQIGELHTDHPATIGVPCHELGHDMGLPDLYDLTCVSQGIGGWGLMGYGGWGTAAGDSHLGATPTHLCAWSKDQLGFVTPAVATSNQDYTLVAAGEPGYNVLRVPAGPTESFLIENRQLNNFDAGLYRWCSLSSGGTSGGGLAIWHIDTSIYDNDNWARKMVDLEEANQGLVGYGELDTWPADPVAVRANLHHLFQAGHVADFGDATTPSSKLYNGTTTDIDVSAVSAPDPVMKCYVATQTVNRLAWSTFFGGESTDEITGVARDNSNNVYVTGKTYSDDFPTTPSAYDTSKHDSGSAFVAKFDPSGALVYSTLLETEYIGPTFAEGIAVDGTGSAYVTGRTADYFPTTAGAYDTTYNGDGDAFVTKLNTAGNGLVYSTYLGSGPWPGSDTAWSIAVDNTGKAYVAGETNGSNFPRTVGSAFSGGIDAFVTCLNANGTGLQYSRYLGNSDGDMAYAVAADNYGRAYATGVTYSSGFPTTTGAYDNTLDFADVFVAMLNGVGNLSYSTFLGGSQIEEGHGVAVDSSGYVYVTGYTISGTGAGQFPTTAGAYDTTRSGASDAFITKLNPIAYADLTYSTLLGGAGSETGYGLALNYANEAYVVGVTDSGDFPTQGACFDSQAGADDGFQSVLSADGSSLPFSTFLGGSDDDQAAGVAVTTTGEVYVGGHTASTDFPTTADAYAPDYSGGNSDGFLAKIESGVHVTETVVVGVPDGGETWCADTTVPIRWSDSGAGDYVTVELSRDGPDGPWEVLYASTPNDGAEDWVVSGAGSSDCYLRVTDAGDSALTDISNAAFTVANCDAGDFDGDGDLDLTDFGTFNACESGPDGGTGYGCETGDFDGDGDVDFFDFAEFAVAFTGE